jgi:hypothetical protein
MWTNVVELDRPQRTIWRMRIAYLIIKATHTHTLNTCNSYCFSTATLVATTRLSVRFIRALPVLLGNATTLHDNISCSVRFTAQTVTLDYGKIFCTWDVILIYLYNVCLKYCLSDKCWTSGWDACRSVCVPSRLLLLSAVERNLIVSTNVSKARL